jgi:deazaflavin-dependent oxidoreductase (nitroreductase family)
MSALDHAPASAPSAAAPRIGLKSRVLRRVVATFNPLARPLAGRRLVPLWAKVTHVGRVSGRSMSVPVAIIRTRDGFIIPTPFGAAQWPRNVLAAGRVELRWKGRDWIANTVAAEGAEGSAEFSAFERAMLGAAGVRRFLRLRDVAEVAR